MPQCCVLQPMLHRVAGGFDAVRAAYVGGGAASARGGFVVMCEHLLHLCCGVLNIRFRPEVAGCVRTVAAIELNELEPDEV